MTLRVRAWMWAPPVVLMGAIFLFSAQPDLNSGLGVADTIGRKIIHACEYGLLAFLWWRALATTSLRPHAIALAFLLTVAYAGTDEYHQTFVQGRHGTPVDVLIDSAGAALALTQAGRRYR